MPVLEREVGIKRTEIDSNCLPVLGPALINHEGVEGGYVPAMQLLAGRGCRPEVLSRYFSPEGWWIYKVSDGTKFWEKPFDKMKTFLGTNFLEAYNVLARASLDTIRESGFNLHDAEHIDKVTQTVIGILRLAGYRDEAVLQCAVAAAMLHDIGNIFSRQAHSSLSVSVAVRSIDGIREDPIKYKTFDEAVRFHDESSLKEDILHWGGNLGALQIIEHMRLRYSPVTLALYIADKVQIGRDRVNDIKRSSQPVDEPHAEVNLLGKTTEIVISPDETEAVWRLEFLPLMHGIDLERLTNYSRDKSDGEGKKPFVSAQTQALFNRNPFPVPYFHRWNELIKTLYHERTVIAIYALFALFPKLKKAHIIMHDGPRSKQRETAMAGQKIAVERKPIEYIRGGETAITTFTLEGLDAELNLLRIKHVPKQKRKDPNINL